MKIGKPPITREHGSWAFLVVPLMVGILGADSATLNSLWFAVAALGVFLSNTPVQALARLNPSLRMLTDDMRSHLLWAGIYLTVAAICLLLLVLQGLMYLILFSAGAFVIFVVYTAMMRISGKTVWTDLVATCGLTLGSPAMYYVITGQLGFVATLLWVLTLVFFGSTVFYVHMKIDRLGLRKSHLNWPERLQTGKMNLAYHLVIASLFAIAWSAHVIPSWVIFAIAPMGVHAVLGTMRAVETQRLRKLGYVLVVQSIAFVVLLSILIQRGDT